MCHNPAYHIITTNQPTKIYLRSAIFCEPIVGAHCEVNYVPLRCCQTLKIWKIKLGIQTRNKKHYKHQKKINHHKKSLVRQKSRDRVAAVINYCKHYSIPQYSKTLSTRRGDEQRMSAHLTAWTTLSTLATVAHHADIRASMSDR